MYIYLQTYVYIYIYIYIYYLSHSEQQRSGRCCPANLPFTAKAAQL